MLIHAGVSQAEAEELAEFFYRNGVEITDKPYFKTLGDVRQITELFKVAAECYDNWQMPTKTQGVVHLVSFRDAESLKIKGFLLYLMGNPWWSSKCRCVCELAVMSMSNRPCGIGRMAARFLKTLVSLKVADVVETGTSISTMSSTDMGNSYKKVGFKPTPSFIYCKQE